MNTAIYLLALGIIAVIQVLPLRLVAQAGRGIGALEIGRAHV